MQQEESIDVAGGKIPTSLRLSPGLRIIQTWAHFLSLVSGDNGWL